jgi:hypothetical protein
MRTQGIYEIRNVRNNRAYIGKSTDIRTRWQQHRHELRCGRHINKALQADWNEHGEEAFTFAVAEEVADESRLFEVEGEHMGRGFNLYNAAPPIRLRPSTLRIVENTPQPDDTHRCTCCGEPLFKYIEVRVYSEGVIATYIDGEPRPDAKVNLTIEY